MYKVEQTDVHQPADFFHGVSALMIKLQGELLALGIEPFLASAFVASGAGR
ncbi:hypothetical protein PQR70_42165 [Paraburkholderia madseniana]|uniref:hypothetical protein n=1 Tax=Paraburkholderia madseniana TaxID=2599607 RepID=UPI0038B88FA9